MSVCPIMLPMKPGQTIYPRDCGAISNFIKYKSSKNWHQVIVNHNGDHSKSEILETLMAMVTSNAFYPCYYSEEPLRDTFLVRNSYEHLESLYKARLSVTMPSKVDTPVQLALRMNMYDDKPGQIDVHAQIEKAVEQVFNLMDKTLNLEMFPFRPELKFIEVVLTNPSTLAKILLQCSRRFLGNVQHIKLSKNSLRNCNGLQPLTWMKRLISVDLSYNMIENVTDIESIPKLPLHHISLAGNPFCKKFDTSISYMAAVKKLFPDLLTLDGESMNATCLGAVHQNYLCSLSGYDLVEQFVQQYFTMYDLVGRINLRFLYDADNAIATLSANLYGQFGKTDAAIQKYRQASRNLKPQINWARIQATTVVGARNIEALWREFGKTEHDLQTLTVDLTYYTPRLIVLTVSGLFKETDPSFDGEELILSFVRTFVLQPIAEKMGLFGCSKQYCITNEQVLITRPSVRQMTCGISRPITADIEPVLTKDDREALTMMFQHLTKLVHLWCVRCLEQSNWKFKNALELYVHMRRDGNIPDDAFVPDYDYND